MPGGDKGADESKSDDIADEFADENRVCEDVYICLKKKEIVRGRWRRGKIY